MGDPGLVLGAVAAREARGLLWCLMGFFDHSVWHQCVFLSAFFLTERSVQPLFQAHFFVLGTKKKGRQAGRIKLSLANPKDLFSDRKHGT